MNRRDVQRIARQTVAGERRAQGGTTRRRSRPNTFVVGLVPMVAPAGGIPAGGSAVCTYRVRTGTTLVANPGDTETVYNDFGAGVAPDAKLWCTWFDGLLWAVIEDCS